MHFQWDWLCLGVLIISSVTVGMENKENLDADVEVENFDKQSQEADVDRDKSSLEVSWLNKRCIVTTRASYSAFE